MTRQNAPLGSSGRLLRAAAVLVPLGLTLVPVACSTSATNGATPLGGACFLATDCVPGLVCVPQKDGSRVCTDDLSGVAGRVPPEGGADATGDAPRDAPAADVTPPNDSGGQDTGTDTGGALLDAPDDG